MRQLADCSGRWLGRWIQGGHVTWDTSAMAFFEGHAVGCGNDQNGETSFTGTYGGTRPYEVRLTKHFNSEAGFRLTLICIGEWDGVVVTGAWFDEERLGVCGEFEMWPRAGQIGLGLILEGRLGNPFLDD